MENNKISTEWINTAMLILICEKLDISEYDVTTKTLEIQESKKLNLKKNGTRTRR